MAEEQVSIEFDLRELKQIESMLAMINRHGGNIAIPLKRWGAYQLKQTDLTFRREGRGPVKWKPLSPMTIAMREWSGRGKGSRKPLQVSGHLRQTIDTVFVKTRKGAAQAIFSRVPYAKMHQEGGEIHIPARTIEPKKKKALAFFAKTGWRSGGSEMVIVKRVHQPARTSKVPKRPFLFITKEDERKGIELIKDHAQEITKKAGFK